MTYKVSAEEKAALSLNESEPVAAVLQQVAVLLTTKQGTVPLFREFGLPQNFLDKPVNVAKPLLYLEVKEAIERFVPQVELVNIEFKADEARPGRIVPIVEVRVKDEAEQ